MALENKYVLRIEKERKEYKEELEKQKRIRDYYKDESEERWKRIQQCNIEKELLRRKVADLEVTNEGLMAQNRNLVNNNM